MITKLSRLVCILTVLASTAYAQFQYVPADQVSINRTNINVLQGTNVQQVINYIDTNWPSSATNWSKYPATQTVDMANNAVTNVGAITLGGETRTNWPTGGGSTNLSAYNNDVGFLTNLFTVGGGRLFVTEDGPTSILWHVTSGGHTNKLLKAYSD